MNYSSSSASPIGESGDNTEQFIQFYSENHCLWQVTNAQYKNRYARDDAIRTIARELTISTQEAKDKVRTLRTYYNSERRKTRK